MTKSLKFDCNWIFLQLYFEGRICQKKIDKTCFFEHEMLNTAATQNIIQR